VVWLHFSHIPSDYYYQGRLENFGIGSDVHDAKKIASAVDRAIVDKERIWLILDDPGVTSNAAKDSLVKRFRSRSVLGEQKNYLEIEVYLFDVRGSPNDSEKIGIWK
jgi:hypothetical protein